MSTVAMGFIRRTAVPAGDVGCFSYIVESSNRLSNLGTSPYTSRHKLLPPVYSLAHISPSYTNSHIVGSEAIPKHMEGQSHHQRCSSESFLLEQPSWLDDLLNEPETQVCRGHRRSASDSSDYLGFVAKKFNTNEENNFKNSIAAPGGSQNLVHHLDPWHASFDKMPISSDKQHNRVSESSLNSVTYSSGHSPARDNITYQISLSSSAPKESQGLSSIAIKKCDQEDSGSQNKEGSTERCNGLHTKPSVSKADAKRSKQKSAHRSRVRKLQYTTDLEMNIQVLQSERSEASAALEFLDQQKLILAMENRALRQRLDSLSQEHLIKHLEQDVLEREILRLRTLCQLQLHQRSKLHQNKSRDLDPQSANLSI